MLELIQDGGWVMYPLLFCSFLIWAVAFEKFLFLGQFQRESEKLYAKAKNLILEKKINEAKGLCHTVHPMVSTPYLTLFEGQGTEKDIWEQRIGRRILETNLGLKKFLWIIGTIGSSAPFIGLFGTVVGIIKSFENIAQTGKSGFAVVAEGLSEALIATAAGILVAVMAVILYNYFLTRLARINIEYKNRIEDLMDEMV